MIPPLNFDADFPDPFLQDEFDEIGREDDDEDEWIDEDDDEDEWIDEDDWDNNQF